MLKRFWDFIADDETIASGITVISSIFVSCAGLAVVFLV